MVHVMRKLWIVLGSIVALIIIVILCIPFFINAEKFRPMVESKGKEALGRDLTIKSMQVSLLKGGVVLEGVSIADDPAFSNQPFLTAKSLTVGVEMMPLLMSRDVRVTSVQLDEPQINLMRNAAGKWNFASLGSGTSPESKATSSGSQNFSVQDLRIAHGRITVDQAIKRHTYDDVNVRLQNFSDKTAFPFSVDAKTPGGGSLSVEGEAGPMAKGDISATPLHGTIKVEGLDLAASGFVDPDTGIAGVVDYDGTVKSDGKNLHSEGKISAKNLKLVKGGSPSQEVIHLDYASDLDLEAKKGTISRADVSAGNGTNPAHFTGTVDTHAQTIVVNGTLKATKMPVETIEGLLPAVGVVLPSGSQLQGGTVNADLNIQGPIDRLVTSGPIDIANSKLAGFNLKSRASGIGALAGIPSGSDLLIQALDSKVRVAPDGIRADNLQLVVPSVGTLTGDGTIGANNSLNFKMKAKLTNGGGAVGQLANLTNLGQAKGEIPFLIQGTTQNPVFLPDVAGMVGNSFKAPIQGTQGIGNIIGGLFGKKKGK
jgi:AsmA protein